jgi:hypothetical protein
MSASTSIECPSRAHDTARIIEYQRAWQANRDGFAPAVTAL